MESLAPLKGNSHPRAHTWLAADLIDRGQKGEPINTETLKFHLKRGTSGDDIPPVLLLVYSQLLQQENKIAESQEFLKRAAQFDPKLLLSSIVVYTQNGLPAQAKATADLLVEKVTDKKGQTSEENIVTAAQAYVLTNRIDSALDVLKAGYKRLPQSAKLSHALSDAFRLKFRASSARLNNQVQVNLEYLDLAIAIDPTNILIQEELSALAQMGIAQNEATVEALRVRIATLGTSFASRLLLAESSLRRGDLASAINDYEVVLAELPRMTLALNNLAMLYTQAVPPRLDASLELIDRAIESSPAVSEFHDSRGDILSALKRKDDSVASYLVSLSSAPQRIKTREKLIAMYEELGQPEQAQIQRDLLAKVKQALEEQRSKTQAVSGEKVPSKKPAEPTDESAPVQEEKGIVTGGTER
jgi:tetratricopeptide (TPR) repeat protein